MKREIKLGIVVAILCVVLFLILMAIGSKFDNPNAGKQDGENVTEGIVSELENLDEQGTEDIESTEGVAGEENNTEIGEYQNFAIADVDSYVNVRQEPNTDCEVLGKLYDGAVAQILETVGEGENQWFKVISGSVEGYMTGRLSNNMLVHFPGDKDLIGKIVNVKLIESKGFYYSGQII